jgi:hypothetical protein
VDNTRVFAPLPDIDPQSSALSPATNAPVGAGREAQLGAGLYRCVLDIKSGAHVGLRALVAAAASFLSCGVDNVDGCAQPRPGGAPSRIHDSNTRRAVPIGVRICALRVLQRALRAEPWCIVPEVTLPSPVAHGGGTRVGGGSSIGRVRQALGGSRSSTVASDLLAYCADELERLSQVSPRTLLLTPRSSVSGIRHHRMHTPRRDLFNSFQRGSQSQSQASLSCDESVVGGRVEAVGGRQVDPVSSKGGVSNLDLELLQQVLRTFIVVSASQQGGVGSK